MIIKIFKSAVLISLMLCSTGMLQLGCDDTGPAPPSGITSFRYVALSYTDCILCGWRYHFYVSDNSSGQSFYYWIGVFNPSNRMLARGEAMLLETPFYDSLVSVDLDHTFADLDQNNSFSGNLHFVLYRTNNPAFVGYPDSCYSDADTMLSVDIQIQSDCFHACCKNTKERYKSYALKHLSDADGISALIKSRFGKLCGEYYGNNTLAQSSAWVGLQDSIYGTFTPFIQTGYMILRLQDSTKIDTIIYAEFRERSPEASVLIRSNTIKPQDNEIYKYSIEYNQTLGRFDILFNGNYWLYIDLISWDDKTFEYGAWVSEICGFETDMSGTRNNPCTFTNCEYRNQYESFQSALFNDANDYIGVTTHIVGQPPQWYIGYKNQYDSLCIYDFYVQ